MGIMFLMDSLSLICLLIGLVKNQSIILAPNDLTRTLGDTATFVCITEDFTVMSWDFKNDAIYTYENGAEYYPHGTEKYAVVQDGRNFTLTVKDLSFGDGGAYICKGLTKEVAASLVILDQPMLIAPDSFPDKFPTIVFCHAHYNGLGNDTGLAPGHHPMLKMWINDQPLEGETINQEIELAPDKFLIMQHQYASLTSDMDGALITCSFFTSNPVGSINTTAKVQVDLQQITKQCFRTDEWKTGLAVALPLSAALVFISCFLYTYKRGVKNWLPLCGRGQPEA